MIISRITPVLSEISAVMLSLDRLQSGRFQKVTSENRVREV
jgi:hypothetical protein